MTVGRDRVFISYRRQDSKAVAGHLRDSLRALLGPKRVFQDVEMAPGTAFPAELGAELDRAAIVLVLIGDTWLSAADRFFKRRIDDENDWVRKEVAIALGSEAAVWPVTVDDTNIPPAEALPDTIGELAHRQRAVVRNDHWDDDVGLLATKIFEATGWAPPQVSDEAISAGLDPGVTAQVDPSGTVIFGHPPIVTNHFHNRPALLEQIGAVEPMSLAVVAGIGGVGKSQLAAKYFSDHASEYDFACWIDMRDRDGRAGFEEIADGLDLTGEGTKPAERTRNHIMGSQARWLIVFDNALQPDQVDPLWPQSPQVKAVATTRHRHWGQLGKTINVPLFDEDAAVTLLRARAGAGYEDDPDAADLVADLGYLPIAIGLAGSYCARMGYSFARYRRRLKEDPAPVLSERSSDEYDEAVASLWTDSLAAAESVEPGVQILAELLAVIDWTSIDRLWLTERAGASNIGGLSVDRLDEMLAALRSFSLIDFEGQRVAIAHNLLADGIARSADRSSLASNVADLLADSLPDAGPTIETVGRAAEPLRHLQYLALRNPNMVAVELLATLRVATDQLNRQGSMSPVLHLAVLELHEHLLDLDHPETIRARASLATHEQQAGHTETAIVLRERVRDDSRRILGEDHPHSLRAQANLAASYWQAERFDEAIAIEELVLGKRQRTLGDDHADTLRAQANLAASYQQAGRINEAIAIQQQVLSKRQRTIGDDHADTLRAQNNLAVSYLLAEQFDEAITLGEQVLTNSQRIFGKDHPYTLRSQGNLALSYWQAGRQGDAVTLMEEAYRHRQQIIGEDHPDTAKARQALIDWYRQLGRDAEADALG